MSKQTNAPRTYDPDGLRRRAACVCFRDHTEKEVLLISSMGDSDKWLMPGGGIDPGEDTETAAVREAWEEAGVSGVINRLLGVFENMEKRTRTWVFAFYVTHLHEDWDEDVRHRRWFQLREAKQVLSARSPTQLHYLNSSEQTKVQA